MDDCLEIGGQFRLPSTAGPVTIASIRAEVANGAMAGIVGNWMGIPSAMPDWRETFSFLLPPTISSSPKAFWLAWLRHQYPGYDHYVMVGNDPHGHENRPAYWDRLYPGSLPVQHVPGDHLQSNDIAAAAQAGWEFVREDEWAAGHRTGRVPPPLPHDPFYSFPKGARLPMQFKTFSTPEILKSDDAKGIIEALVSVTGNKDHQRDIIDPGAWAKAIETAKAGRMPRITSDHKWSVEHMLGRTLDIEEWLPGDSRLPDSLKSKGFGALWVRGQLNLDKQRARDVYSDLKGGYVNEFSVGFDIATDDEGKKCEAQEDDAFHIKAIDPLYE
ncbi:MAG TPA: HK97 family phage prohead protease, partial [Acidimicrobiales bacterium]|nr:HK97 family phage prohead protease [Acidimicrobiales bacterium]